jgi:hypothetical protein
MFALYTVIMQYFKNSLPRSITISDNFEDLLLKVWKIAAIILKFWRDKTLSATITVSITNLHPLWLWPQDLHIREVVGRRGGDMLQIREYWMIYRGPGFLAVVWFGSTPTPTSPVSKVDQRHTTQEDWERETIRWRERGKGGGRGAESCDRMKARSVINHSILSVP